MSSFVLLSERQTSAETMAEITRANGTGRHYCCSYPDTHAAPHPPAVAVAAAADDDDDYEEDWMENGNKI